MDKVKYIIAWNNIINDIKIDDNIFNSVIILLQNQNIISNDFTYDSTKTSQKNIILQGINQKTLNYFKIYLGQ